MNKLKWLCCTEYWYVSSKGFYWKAVHNTYRTWWILHCARFSSWLKLTLCFCRKDILQLVAMLRTTVQYLFYSIDLTVSRAFLWSCGRHLEFVKKIKMASQQLIKYGWRSIESVKVERLFTGYMLTLIYKLLRAELTTLILKEKSLLN